MTGKCSRNRDKKASQRNRNKSTDAYGDRYDRRKGHWTDLDRAVLEEGRLLDSWLSPLRV